MSIMLSGERVSATHPSPADSSPPVKNWTTQRDALIETARTASPLEAGHAMRMLDRITGDQAQTNTLILEGNNSGSVETGTKFGPGSAEHTTTITTKVEGKSGPFTADVELSNKTVRSQTENKDGTVTYTVEADVKVTAHGGMDVKEGSVGASESAGQRANYTVTVPKGVDPRSINPHDASGWPVGTRVQIKSDAYTGSALEIGYRNISLVGETEHREGYSLVMEKTAEDKVGVVVGPTEGFTTSGKLKFDTGVGIAVEIGAEKSLDTGQLRAFEVDIGTAEGRGALAAVAAGGDVPTTDGKGVSDLVDIRTMDYSAKVGAKITGTPIGDIGIEAAQSSSYVEKTYPDGRVEHEMSYDSDNDGNADLVVTNSSSDGGRTWGEASYTLRYEVTGDTVDFDRQLAADDDIQPGDTIEVELSAREMTELRERTGFGDYLGDDLTAEQQRSVTTQYAVLRASEGGVAKLFDDYMAPPPYSDEQPRDVDMDHPLPGDVKVIREDR